MSKTVQAVLVGATLAALTGGLGAAAFPTLFTMSAMKTAAWAFGSTLILGGISAALQKQPSLGGAGSLRGRTETVRQSAGERDVVFGRVRKGGTIVLLHTTGNDNRFLHMVIALAGHQVESIGAVYFDGEMAVQADGTVEPDYQGLVTVTKRLGSDNQSAISIPDASDVWTEEHRGRGVAHLYIRLRYDVDAFANGIPNITVDMEGYSQIYDPRTDTTGYTNNAALVLAAYLTDPEFGLGTKLTYADIDEDALIEAANICDEIVPVEDGDDEARYTTDGLFRTDSAPREVIEQLCTAMAGECVHTGGVWRIQVGAYQEPATSYTPTDFRAGLKLQTRVSSRENFNIVRGTFVSPENDWQETDFPAYKSDFYIDEDGFERAKDITLPFTISTSAAQRLAKIELERARRQQTLEAPLKLSGLLARAGGNVGITFPRWGFDAKPFFVKEMGITPLRDGGLGVDLVLRETSPLVYDWEASEAQIIEAAPPTNLPSASNVPQPVAPSVTEEIYVTSNGTGTKVRANLDWSGSSLVYVDRFQVQFRQVGGEWESAPSTSDTFTRINDISPGAYQFRIRAVSRLGVSSPWATTGTITVIGSSAPPVPLQQLTLSGVGGMAVLRWRQHPDIDVRIGGSIVFRHARQLENAAWAASVTIGEEVPGSDTVAVLPLKPGTYLAKARDSGGQLSLDAVAVSTTGGTALAFANVDSIIEHPAWAGDMTDVEEVGGTLRLVEGEAVGTYRFSAGFDFGSPRRVRVITDIDVATVNLGLDIDDRTDPIDDWEDFDGAAGAETDVQIWVRTTDDDPSGSPAWGPWQRMDQAEYFVRAMQFEARLSTGDSAYVPQINELSVFADEVS